MQAVAASSGICNDKIINVTADRDSNEFHRCTENVLFNAIADQRSIFRFYALVNDDVCVSFLVFKVLII